ncbi:MAG: sulfite exporter TauE/SafE family protein [Peptostreptococcaceae bacterium]|nr:sulfite exporter TauE/SafE family protein [Peptostreptococcaceae bacterium]
MSTAKILLIGLAILTIAFLAVFIKDLIDNKSKWESKTNFAVTSIIGFVVNFFDTLGIGSFAPTTAALRFTKQVEDKLIPGTLNVACCIPVVAEAFLFIQGVEVEPVTLASMLISSAAGAYLGAGIVSKLPTKKVQLAMGFALAVTGIIVVLQLLKIFPGGGEAIGLHGSKLVIGIVANFILGALMTAGIGLYAPCMALVYLLGMSPLVAFPIMMGSCAYLMPVASIKFVKEGAYNRKTSLAFTIFGVAGVYVAYKFISGIDLTILKWIVVGVMAYTSASLFMAASKKQTA